MATLSELLSALDRDVSVVLITDSDILGELRGLGGSTMLVLGNMQVLPTLEQWVTIVEAFEQILLHGEKAYRLFCEPYIELEGAMRKTTYCPTYQFIPSVASKFIEGKPEEGRQVRIWLHTDLEKSL